MHPIKMQLIEPLITPFCAEKQSLNTITCNSLCTYKITMLVWHNWIISQSHCLDVRLDML